MVESNLTAARLRELLDYNPSTGLFTRKTRSAKGVYIGEIAGGVDPSGYVKLSLEGKRQYSHRLAWLHMYGVWPTGIIDHVNGDRADNRIVNLRDVSSQINCQNIKTAKPSSKTGLLGASWCKVTNKFKAQIRFGGTNKFIGLFDNANDAHDAYIAAKRQLHAGCTI